MECQYVPHRALDLAQDQIIQVSSIDQCINNWHYYIIIISHATDVCEGVTCEGGECIDVDGVAVCDCEIGTATYSDQYKCEG